MINAYFLVRTITGTGQMYWVLLAHLLQVFGHKPAGFARWWVMTEWHHHPRNLVRVLLHMRATHCQWGMGTTPANPTPHMTYVCRWPGQ